MLDNSIDKQIQLDEENDSYNMSHPHVLTKSQKMAAAGLAFFAFLIVIAWALQFKNGLAKPFDFSALKPKEGESSLAVEEKDASICPGPNCKLSDDELRGRDTDGDRLSDFDEYNVFNTSAFLDDSDSDGVTDNKELDNGTDPNCPSDRNCVASPLVETPSAEEGSQTAAVPVTDSLTGSQVATNTPVSANAQNVSGAVSGDYQKLISGQADAASLRAMLKASGMTDEMLGKISDEELLKTYAEQVKGAGN